MSPINTFNSWAIKDKDIAMQQGHINAVNQMFNLIKNKSKVFNKSFQFLDIGCGNGWVVRKISKFQNCKLAEGVDGASEMIKKARLRDTKGVYYQNNIETWNCEEKFDIIFSMETFYYFENVDLVLHNIYNKLLKENSFFIFGIDHYSENIPSLSWENDIGIKTKTMSIIEWVHKVESHGFENIKHLQFGQKGDWDGTLIISARKLI